MQSNFRIALVGPEATGKSTLAAALARELGVPILADPREELLRNSRYHTLFEADRVQPIWRTLLEQQLERESGLNASTVLDTCALDYWVLWQRWSWCSASPEKAESLYQRLLNVAGEYGLLVRMPAIQLAPPAGHRFINAAYAVQIYRLVTSAISEVAPDVPTVNLDAASPETQLQRTLTRVKDLIAAAR